MLLHIVARGKIGRSPEAELVERYMKRVAWPTRITELPDTGGKVPEQAPGTRIVHVPAGVPDARCASLRCGV